MRAWMRQFLLPLFIGIAVLVGLLYVGKLVYHSLQDHERYQAHFQNIQVTPPKGLKRKQFLLNVQYESEFPDEFSILDKDVRNRLEKAFQRNAWVAKVNDIVIAPSREIRVDLQYRQPVMRVRFRNQERVVDRIGTLLPRLAQMDGLPLYGGKVERPAGRTGTVWGDIQIEQSAKLADYLQSQQLAKKQLQISIEGGELVVKLPKDQRMVWGQFEKKNAEEKVTKLRTMIEKMNED